MDKHILLLALEALWEQVVDAMKNKETKVGIEISEQYLKRIKEQMQILKQ